MQPIQLSVFSETARLKQVVVHNPGPEVDLMVPGMMEKLLFDDILHGDLARYEHGQFRQVLAKVVHGIGTREIHKGNRLADLWEVTAGELLPLAMWLRTFGYESRNSQTNAQIPEGSFRFPTHSQRSRR